MVKVGDTVTVHFTATVERLGNSGVGDGVYVYAITPDDYRVWLTPRQYTTNEEG